MSAFPADAPGVLESPLQRLLAALLAGSETGQVIAGTFVSPPNMVCWRVVRPKYIPLETFCKGGGN